MQNAYHPPRHTKHKFPTNLSSQVQSYNVVCGGTLHAVVQKKCCDITTVLWWDLAVHGVVAIENPRSNILHPVTAPAYRLGLI
jgi:hypothetical protein